MLTKTIIIILIIAVMAAVVSINAVKNKKLMEPIDWLPVIALVLCTLSMTLNLFLISDFSVRTLSFVVMPLVAYLMRTSSIWDTKRSYEIIIAIVCLQVMWIIYHVLCLSGSLSCISAPVYSVFLFFWGTVVTCLFAYGLWQRLGNMRKLMDSSSVWSMLSLGIDALYALCLMMITMSALFVNALHVRHHDAWIMFPCLLAILMQVAFVVRVKRDSMFVLMRGHEDRILESLKVSQLEVMSVDRQDTYKDIYDRLVEYFEKEKPFLRHDLTINEVARDIYSNKLYISRAVNHYTGRNFCQFVNYYRIMYAMEAFRSNPELKVTLLSAMSGFNSVVSFNMAFKLFMLANPGEWCRKERAKLVQKKK